MHKLANPDFTTPWPTVCNRLHPELRAVARRRTGMSRPLLVLFVLVAAAGCAEPSSSVATGSGSDLTVTVTESEGSTPTVWTLTCGADAGGEHPDPAAACAALQAVVDEGGDPFAPVPADAVCTEIYGGSATATITGTWEGEDVDASYSRTNGCEIARWDPLMDVFRTTGTVA
jgi:Subtilisin inhibitor-like